MFFSYNKESPMAYYIIFKTDIAKLFSVVLSVIQEALKSKYKNQFKDLHNQSFSNMCG